MLSFWELVRRRRMVRRYQERPVPEAALERILEGARRAPSAGFSQGQHLVVVTRPEGRRRLAELAGEPEYVARGFEPWLSSAPVHLVLFAHPHEYTARYAQPDKKGLEDWTVPYWHFDAGATCMLVLLGAEAEGLRAGFLGSHRLSGVGSLLGAPEQAICEGLITLGYGLPDRGSGSVRKGRRPAREQIHWQVWDD